MKNSEFQLAPAEIPAITANILLVDDRPDGILAMEAVLASEDYRFMRANSGYEALQYLRKYEFAVILLDVQMPGIDGFETARRIRSYPSSRETPIIFVTAISQENHHVYRGYESGAVDYIFKPVDEFVLRSKVKVFADLYRQNIKLREQDRLIKEIELKEKDRRQREMEIDNSRRYTNLANAIPHVVFKITPGGKFEYVNQRWHDAYGADGSAPEDLDWQVIIHPNDRVKVRRRWSVKDRLRNIQLEVRLKNKKGEYHWHLVSLVPEFRNTTVAGWLGTCIDIQEQKNKENDLRLLSERLNHSNKGLEQFAYIASHDLQEPLRKIITFTELVRRNSNGHSEQEKEYFNRIYHSGYRMKTVIDDLLQYSRISHVPEQYRQVVDLNTTVRGVLADLEVKISQTGARIVLGQLPKVKGNAVQLRLLFQNFIVNAVKFSRKDAPPEIEIGSAAAKGGGARIFVRDNGIGFDPRYTEKIFEPFQRLHRKDEYEGSGIGLSIVKKIIDHHGWEINADSRLGSGSTFTIYIPPQRRK